MASTMYKVAPIQKPTTDGVKMELPDGMYKTPSLYEEFGHGDSNDDGGQNVTSAKQPQRAERSKGALSSQKLPGNDDEALRTALRKQELLIQKLDEFEVKVIEQVTGKKPGMSNTVQGNSRKAVIQERKLLSTKEQEVETLSQLLERQERLMKNLTHLEEEVTDLIGSAAPVEPTPKPPKSESKNKDKNKKKATPPRETIAVKPKTPQQSTPAQPAAAVTSKAPSGAPMTAKSPSGEFSIHCSPDSPPQQIRKLLLHLTGNEKRQVLARALYHSSILGSRSPIPVATWEDIASSGLHSRMQYDLTFTIIFRKFEEGPKSGPYLVNNPLDTSTSICGEANIVKHLVELLSVKNFKI